MISALVSCWKKKETNKKAAQTNSQSNISYVEPKRANIDIFNSKGSSQMTNGYVKVINAHFPVYLSDDCRQRADET